MSSSRSRFNYFLFETLFLKLYQLESIRKGFISTHKIGHDIQITLQLQIPIKDQNHETSFIKHMEKSKFMNFSRFDKFLCSLKFIEYSNGSYFFKGNAKEISLFGRFM
jgi:hypothetical protein